jgi:hypothetical protein
VREGGATRTETLRRATGQRREQGWAASGDPPRALLVKGLEYDHVIIANIADHTNIKDLYVALSRARKSLTILGQTDAIKLKAQPNGK